MSFNNKAMSESPSSIGDHGIDDGPHRGGQNRAKDVTDALEKGGGEDPLALPPGKGGLLGGYFTLLTGAIGVGILSFPYAFRSAGLVGNVVLGLAFAVLNAYTLWILARQAQRYSTPRRQFATYEALVQHVLGNKVYVVLLVSILINTIGALSAYLIVVGQLGHEVLDHFLEDHNDVPEFIYSRAFLVILFCIFVALPLSMFPNIHNLSFSSFLAVATVIGVAGLVIARGIESCIDGKNESGEKIEDAVEILNLRPEFFLAVPLVVFSLGCHLTVVPVHRELKEEKRPRLGNILIITVTTCIIVYLVTGVMGYLRFGDETDGDILGNFPVDDILLDVGKLLMALHVALAYPVGLYPATKALQIVLSFLPVAFFKRDEHTTEGRWRMSIMHWAITFLMMVLTAGMAILVPDVQTVFGLVGSTTAVIINYMGPACLLFVSPLSLPTIDDYEVLNEYRDDFKAKQFVPESPKSPLLSSEAVNTSTHDYNSKPVQSSAAQTPGSIKRSIFAGGWVLDRFIAIGILLLSLFIMVCGTATNIYQTFFK